MRPEDVGVGTANALLGEIAQSGVVDSTHQVSMLAVSFCPFNVSVSSDRYWNWKCRNMTSYRSEKVMIPVDWW